ncbi:MAG: 4-hydroxythreonine-4-phosphate dehydrogenase PdxA [Bacteroidota bacterium]
MTVINKPVIGISCGDLNGIGIELIIKTFSDNRILEFCTPVVFASNKVINFYKKSIPEVNFNYQNTKEFTRLAGKQINLFNCWEEETAINPGQLTDAGGKYAVISLQSAVAALKQKQIDGLVTAPIHKKNIQSAEFSFTGHTPYLKEMFGVNDVVMMLCAGNFRVALVTEHIPVSEVAKHITREAIVSKLAIINKSLQKDFGKILV